MYSNKCICAVCANDILVCNEAWGAYGRNAADSKVCAGDHFCGRDAYQAGDHCVDVHCVDYRNVFYRGDVRDCAAEYDPDLYAFYPIDRQVVVSSDPV